MEFDQEEFGTAAILGGIYGDGIVGLEAAFAPEFIDAMRGDVMALYEEARSVAGGAIRRGPERWYVELQPERMPAFAQIATHPWFVAVCEAVLGPEYKIVELGFDMPFPGAQDQPWHRDFPSPEATLRGRRLNSLVFNLTAVDTLPEHGPFEIALGTQWDDITGCRDDMFPPKELWDRYASRAVRKLPKRGDISARTGLTIHRGTANRSNEPRPVLIIGVAAPDAVDPEYHQLQVTRSYLDSLAPALRDHLTCRVTETLEPIVQHHVIEGLLEADYG